MIVIKVVVTVTIITVILVLLRQNVSFFQIISEFCACDTIEQL